MSCTSICTSTVHSRIPHGAVSCLLLLMLMLYCEHTVQFRCGSKRLGLRPYLCICQVLFQLFFALLVGTYHLSADSVRCLSGDPDTGGGVLTARVVVAGSVSPAQTFVHANWVRGWSHVLLRHRSFHRRRCECLILLYHIPFVIHIGVLAICRIMLGWIGLENVLLRRINNT